MRRHVGRLSLKAREVTSGWWNRASALFIVANANSLMLFVLCRRACVAAGESHCMRFFFFKQRLTATEQRAGGYLPVWRTVSGSKDGKRRQSADLQRKQTCSSGSRLSNVRHELERVRVHVRAHTCPCPSSCSCHFRWWLTARPAGTSTPWWTSQKPKMHGIIRAPLLINPMTCRHGNKVQSCYLSITGGIAQIIKIAIKKLV